MTFQPAFRSVLGSSEFPFEDGRYILYVSLACPFANGVLQVARLKGLVGPIRDQHSVEATMRFAVVSPTWQFTDPKLDASRESKAPHAGWVFVPANQKVLPLAVLKNGPKEFGLDLQVTPEEYCDHCLNSSQPGFAPANDSTIVSSDILRDYGVASEHSTVDPSKHSCKTLRHVYEKCGGQGQRPTTPLVLDTQTDRGVNNESMELATFLNEWGTTGPDLFPASLRSEIEAMNQWIYPINNGVYRCGFASSQPAYDQAAVELEGRMTEVEKYLGEGSRRFLVGDSLTISDIRLFNTLIRMDEVYVTYFKCYFASLFAPFGEAGASKFPNLLRFTARVYNEFPEIRECLSMDDIRAHYYTSHAIRNMFGIIPKEVGVLRRLEEMKEQ
jgi:glutathionyl-hydroquinone reductase